jgi:hypothetical protein
MINCFSGSCMEHGVRAMNICPEGYGYATKWVEKSV